MKAVSFAGFGELQEMPAMLKWESRPGGWRALTAEGEVINVKGTSKPNGHGIFVETAGNLQQTTLPSETPGQIAEYSRHYDRAGWLFRNNDFEGALVEINNAARIAETACLRHQRGLILLSLGRWTEGFADLTWCEHNSRMFMRPMHRRAVALGLEPWRGQDLKGKYLLVLGDYGLGDTIMMLRYVRELRKTAGHVAIVVPPELEWLTSQIAPEPERMQDADYFCSDLLMLGLLASGPEDVVPMDYLQPPAALVGSWRDRLGPCTKPRIGVAWSVGQEIATDYPRSMPLRSLLNLLPDDVEVHSVQKQGQDEADWNAVIAHDFADLADCAALMMQMDHIVSIDTCALHLAGAIGHPRVSGLLSKWHSWRWQASWYRHMDLRVVARGG